jgi:hypothetical protein
LVLTHQESGWTDRRVALEYLHWLSERVRGQGLCLLWDSFAAHRDEEVRAQAAATDVALKFIPTGMTDEWQPLDLRIFGSLKQRAKALFDQEWMRDPDTELTTETVIELLLQAWRAITQEEVLNAWNKLESS